MEDIKNNIELYKRIVEYNALSDSEIRNIAEKHFFGWFNKNSTANKIFSRKSTAKIESQYFGIHQPARKCHICYTVGCNKKRNSIIYFVMLVYYASSKKGMLYFTKDSVSPLVFSFYSHFFDRMSQREYNSELSRSLAIQRFVRQVSFGQGDYFYVLNMQSREVIGFVKNGVVLGCFEEVPLKINETVETYRFISHNTYITKDMMRPDQCELYDAAINKKLSSNFSIFSGISFDRHPPRVAYIGDQKNTEDVRDKSH